MRHFLKIFILALLPTASSQAALSIVIEPSLPGYTNWTLTQTSPSPDISVVDVLGSGGSMQLPVSMFDAAWFGSVPTPSLLGSFASVFATVVEIYSNQTFVIDTLSVENHPRLEFDHPYTLPNGNTVARFEVTAATPSLIEFDHRLLTPGVHSINSTFGLLTVTVIPEPSMLFLLLPTTLSLAIRRRIS